MRFTAVAETDIGISKSVNQDSVLIKHAYYDKTEILMALLCDGMGGLAKGELASATVIRTFSEWFDRQLPLEFENLDLDIISEKWTLMEKDLNARIMEYGRARGEKLGTTFSAILMIGENYVIHHVGDSRIYHIGAAVKQLTTDHTLVEWERRRGNITLEQAKTDKRRHILLQCIGASETVHPQVLAHRVENGIYMLCSDGMYHMVTESEMQEVLRPDDLTDREIMQERGRLLIERAKMRREKDNISVILIRVREDEQPCRSLPYQ